MLHEQVKYFAIHPGAVSATFAAATLPRRRRSFQLPPMPHRYTTRAPQRRRAGTIRPRWICLKRRLRPTLRMTTRHIISISQNNCLTSNSQISLNRVRVTQTTMATNNSLTSSRETTSNRKRAIRSKVIRSRNLNRVIQSRETSKARIAIPQTRVTGVVI